jgi:hypothetical protein
VPQEKGRGAENSPSSAARLEKGAANYEFSDRILLRAALFHLKQMTPCSQFSQICAAAKEAFRRVAAMKHSLCRTPLLLCVARKF